MKSCVLSVMYPKAIPYADEFLNSLAAQTDKEFELLVINDGAKDLEKKLRVSGLRVRVSPASGTPASLRKRAIAWALKNGFEIVIFADADDMFHPARVEISKALVHKSGFVFNELEPFEDTPGDRMPLLGARLKEGATIVEEDLLDRNCLGLSNTALAAKLLTGDYAAIPDDAVAYDWALFARLLHHGQAATFTAKTSTHYRRHEDSLAMLDAGQDASILKAVCVKWNHYASLVSLGEEYKSREKYFKELLQKLDTNEMFRRRYCDAVRNKCPKNAWWWEAVKQEGELGL